MKSLIVCVDFDGTIVEHEFPDVGAEQPHAFRVLKRIIAAGHRLVLSTCREDTKRRMYLTEAIDWCKLGGVEFVSVNENRQEDDFREEGLRRKVFAHVYIDDRNLGGFPGWLEVEKHFLEKGWLTND